MLSTVIHHFRRNVVAYLALFLALGGTSYATWLAPANSVNSQAIIDGQVTTPDLAPNAIRADEFCVLGSCVGSKEIANNAVSSGELASGAVGTSKIADQAITTGKLAAGAVGNGQLAAGAVGNGQLAAGSVGNSQLAANAVTGDKVKDGSLTAADIGYQIVSNDTPMAPGQIGQVGAECPNGKVVVGGGVANTSLGPVFQSVPKPNGTAWLGVGTNTSDSQQYLEVDAICVNAGG